MISWRTRTLLPLMPIFLRLRRLRSLRSPLVSELPSFVMEPTLYLKRLARVMVCRAKWPNSHILHTPWHFLNFLPLPHGHLELRPTFPAARTLTMSDACFSQAVQVHAGGCCSNQFGLTITLCRRPHFDNNSLAHRQLPRTPISPPHTTLILHDRDW